MANSSLTVDLTSNNAKPSGNIPIYPASSVSVHTPYTGAVAHVQTAVPVVTNRSVIQVAKSAPPLAPKQVPVVPAVPARTILPQTYQSKYGELLNVIEDLGREIKPTYAGSKMAQERLKKGIMHARTLVRECLLEVDKSARQ